MYDAIVIGAGPAGCMAAKRIASASYKVLLVEKKRVPRVKSCSGILISKSVDIIEREFGKIPEFALCKPEMNRGIIITNEDNKEYRFESEGLNIWRDLLDYWMIMKLKDEGVEFRAATLAVSCEEKDNHVVVGLKKDKNFYEKAKTVIVCGGAGNIIKNKFVKTCNNHVITHQVFCKGTIDLDKNFFHAYLNPDYSEYDAWFNVKDDYLIFGVAVKDVTKINSYYSKFISFLSTQYNAKIESQDKEERWIMPLIDSKFNINLGNGRILFAGESANFLNPVGEGISSALTSGYYAGEAVKSIDLEYNDNDDLLTIYKANIEKERHYMIRQWKLLAKISSRFSDLLLVNVTN